MATEEDFSFPTTTDTPPRFIESPPLWRTTSASGPASLPSTPQREETKRSPYDRQVYYYDVHASKKGKNSMLQRKSFSHIEVGTKPMKSDEEGSDVGDDQGEKMDMLWEDFNEEFSSRNSKSTTIGDHSDRMSPGRMLNFGCVQSLKLSKPSKKPSIVVLMKVLKKMLLLQNSRRPIKKSQC